MDFRWAMGVSVESGQRWSQQLRGAVVLGHPVVVFLLRSGLSVGFAGLRWLGSDGMLRGVLTPFRRTPRPGDTDWGGGLAFAVGNNDRWSA